MSPDRYMLSSCYALGAALVLATNTAVADGSAPQPSAYQSPVKLAVADSTATMSEPPGTTAPYIYPSSEAGIRRAAAQGPASLRRYIFRTRMIYNYYFWDFVGKE